MDPKLLEALIAIAKLEAGELQLRERIRQLEAVAMERPDINVQTTVNAGTEIKSEKDMHLGDIASEGGTINKDK